MAGRAPKVSAVSVPADHSGSSAAPSPAASPSPTPSTTLTSGEKEKDKEKAGRPARKGSALHALTPEQRIMAEAQAMEEAEAYCTSLVAMMVDLSCAKLAEHHAQQCAMRDTARHAVELVMQAVEWQLLSHDEGEKLSLRSLLTTPPDQSAAAPPAAIPSSSFSPLTPDDSFERTRAESDLIAQKLLLPQPYNQIWACEEEPEPMDLDRWARGVIPTKTHAASGAAAGTDALGATGAFTVHEAEGGVARTMSPTRPSHTRGAHSLHIRSPSLTVRSGGMSLRSPSSHAAKSAQEQAAELLALKANAQPYRVEVVQSSEEIARERSRESELRRLEKKKHAANEAAAARAADEAERARIEQLQADLRAKNYTLDNRGNAILVAPAAASSLPPLQPTPLVRVREVFLTDEEEAEIAKKAKRQRNKGVAPPSTTQARTGAKAEEEKQQTHSSAAAAQRNNHLTSTQQKVQKSTRVEPPATQAKSIPAKREQPLVRAADPRVQSHGGPGSLVGGRTVASSDSSAAAAKPDSRRVSLTTALPAVSSTHSSHAPPVRVLVGSPGVSLSRPSSARRHALPSDGPSRNDANDALDASWARRDASPSRALGASGVSQGVALHRPSSGDLFNRQLTSDPAWGSNTASGPRAPAPARSPQPHRPSAADREAAVGKVARHPRERPFVDTKATQGERRRLPPAPLGKTMGHGFDVSGAVAHSSATSTPGLGATFAPASPSSPTRQGSAGVHGRQPTSPTRPFGKVPRAAVVTMTGLAKEYLQE